VNERPPAFAIEGPCCAGKTTLSRSLLLRWRTRSIAHAHCYADQAGGGRFLPDPEPRSPTDDQDGLTALLDIEEARLEAARKPGVEAVVMDRSVHTFLAHRVALSQMSGVDFEGPATERVRESSQAWWPDRVVYLDTPQWAIEERNRGKFPEGSIFTRRDFNIAARSYFERLAIDAPSLVLWIDATLVPEAISDVVAAELEGRLG
jgi:thymidylate kinase